MSDPNATPIVVIAYAAKSSPDVGGSIPTQLAAIREAVEREGDREIVTEHRDEAISAYSKSRGPGLEAALTHAEALAREVESVELWIAHSDRLARGDGKRAKHLIEHKLWSIKTDVRLRSVGDDRSLDDLLHAALTGERNFEDSRAKSQHVRRGKRQRFEDGRSTGPLNYGYTLSPQLDDDGRPITKRDGRVIYERVPDPERRQHVERIFTMAERGHTHGEIMRALNADGIPTKRGGTWSIPTIRRMLRDPYYAGKVRQHGELRDGEHDAIIEWERFEALQAKLARRDPVKQRQRNGGRPTKRSDYLLRGLLTCARCGYAMAVRDLASGRSYICTCVRERRGTCDLPIIDADLIEKPTLAHLRGGFGIDLRTWIEERLSERDQSLRVLETRLDHERDELAERERKVAKAKANVANLIADRPDLAARALEALDALEAQAVEQAEHVRELEAERAEHDSAISSDDVLRRYEELHALVDGGLSRAKDTAALNTALRSLLSVATVDWIEHVGVLVDFTLVSDGPGLNAFAVGGQPDRIRGENYYSQSEHTDQWFAKPIASAERPGKPERTPWSTFARRSSLRSRGG